MGSKTMPKFRQISVLIGKMSETKLKKSRTDICLSRTDFCPDIVGIFKKMFFPGRNFSRMRIRTSTRAFASKMGGVHFFHHQRAHIRKTMQASQSIKSAEWIRLRDISQTLYSSSDVRNLFQASCEEKKIEFAHLMYSEISTGHYIIALCQDNGGLNFVRSKGKTKTVIMNVISTEYFRDGELFLSSKDYVGSTFDAMRKIRFIHQDKFVEQFGTTEGNEPQIDCPLDHPHFVATLSSKDDEALDKPAALIDSPLYRPDVEEKDAADNEKLIDPTEVFNVEPTPTMALPRKQRKFSLKETVDIAEEMQKHILASKKNASPCVMGFNCLTATNSDNLLYFKGIGKGRSLAKELPRTTKYCLQCTADNGGKEVCMCDMCYTLVHAQMGIWVLGPNTCALARLINSENGVLQLDL